MINSRKDLKYYLKHDAIANGRKNIKPKVFGDYTWKYLVQYRKTEYHFNSFKNGNKLHFIPYLISKYKLSKLSIKTGYSIGLNVFEEGLSIAHLGTIVVTQYAKVGKNCRIHEGVTIGTTNGIKKAPHIGNNVFIGTGAKIIGAVSIADDVAIGANAVVVKNIATKGTTWGGVPAKKISDNDSHSNLNKNLKL